METEQPEARKLGAIDPQWGEGAADHFGYASDEERRA